MGNGIETELPPRVRIRNCHEGCQHIVSSSSLGAEYLSLAEHEQLMAAEQQRGLRAVEEARAKAFEDVLAAAERIYQEELDSDPSDYFYTKKAVAEAQASRAAKEPS